MKKNYLLLILFFSAFALQAQTVYYVDGATGNDGNDGSQTSPWATLNPEVWAPGGNDCIIYIASGESFLNNMTAIGANVQLIGTSKDEVALMGENDEDFWDDSRGDLPFTNGAFVVPEGASLTIKNITLKNQRRVSAWGGSIRVAWGATLTLENVDVLNSIVNAGGGGAIDSDGTLNLTNVLFKGCYAPDCAVINFFTNKDRGDDGIIRGVFEKVRFIENESRGCLVNMEASDKIDVSFNNCLFEKNKTGNWGTVLQFQSRTSGMIEGMYIHAKISNTSFIENTGDNAGCIAVYTDPDKQREMDLYITNCLFLKNKIAGYHSTVFTVNGPQNDKITGNLVFANNTMVENGNLTPGNESTTLAIQDQPLTMVFVNNIAYSNIPGSLSVVMWNEGFGTTIASNNFFDTLGGTDSQLEIFRDPSKNTIAGGYILNENGELVYQNPNDVLKLKTEPTYPASGGVPYLELQTGSIAIDAGLNSLSLSGEEIVPQQDIRGIGIYNNTKDAGTYEYNGLSSIANPLINKEIHAYPNPFKDVVYLKGEVAKAEIYDITGTRYISSGKVAEINASQLPSGIYLLRIITLDGKINVLKIKK
jgi:hypothetical protein